MFPGFLEEPTEEIGKTLGDENSYCYEDEGACLFGEGHGSGGWVVEEGGKERGGIVVP